MLPRPPKSTLFPTRRSSDLHPMVGVLAAVWNTGERLMLEHIALAFGLSFVIGFERELRGTPAGDRTYALVGTGAAAITTVRSEEHTSELQSPDHLVCRLLLE